MKTKHAIANLICILLTAHATAGIQMFPMQSSPTPSAEYKKFKTSPAKSAVILTNVPTSTWTYGCSATAAGIIFGYYDRIGYENMYTGPANNGIAPLKNLGKKCSIIATKEGFDGRTTPGHVDDYWLGIGSRGPDPWKINNSIQHEWSVCTADFLGTNQWKWDYDADNSIEFNADGSTALWLPNAPWRLRDYTPPESAGTPTTSLCHGLKLFAESRGYRVLSNYSQRIDTYHPAAFSFRKFKREIDAERPVMIQLRGHSMVGVGYDEKSQIIYVHDTWDNNIHRMKWGGHYAGMQQIAVTVLSLAPPKHPIAPIPEPATFLLLSLPAVIKLRKK